MSNSDFEIQQDTTKEEDINIEHTFNMTCPTCSKVFKTLQGLKKHLGKCKGVSNPLECHFCHKIFNIQQSKSKHLKTCAMKKAQEDVQNKVHMIEENKDINIQNTDKQIIYNIAITYNNYYVSDNNFYNESNQ